MSTFRNWTQADAEAHNARVCGHFKSELEYRKPNGETYLVREFELHAQILDECTRRGWICFHGSMAHKTKRVLGEPDFQILADGGRLLLIEAKTRRGKLSHEQAAMQAWARKLGHTIHVVRSFSEFLEVAK